MLYKNLINGAWVPAKSGKTFQSLNPADTSDVLGEFPASEEAEVEQAVAAADKALPSWSRTPAPKRADILFKATQELERHKQELGELMTREMGKVLNEALGDVQEGIDMTYYIAGEGRRLQGYTTPSELPDKAAYAIRRPIGRLALITPWNFPLAIPTWKIMPALVGGNTVVFKPASDTPRVAYELGKILHEQGVPPGVFNMVFGSGSKAGVPLAAHSKIDMISFTGSADTGRMIYEVGAKKLIQVHLELGGKNPIVVLEDGNLDLAMEGIIWSAFGTTGQRCTACSRLIIEDGVYDELLERVTEAAGKLRLGNGLKRGTDVGPVINQAALAKIDHYVQLGKNEGAKALVGGEPAPKGELSKGFFYQPTVFANVTPKMTIWREEIFGPVLSVIKARDFDDAIQLANDTHYGLSSSIYTQDINKAMHAIDLLEAGITYINSGTIGAEVHLPFGGCKDTGNGGREAGIAAIDEYTEWKTVFIDYSGKLQKAQGID
jgi:aldehyde dehydrogenase (NAD+)